MKQKSETKTNKRDILVGLIIGLMLLGVVLGTSFFHFTGPIQTLIWLVWLVFSLGLGFFTVKGKQFFDFAEEAKTELQKVVWPSRQETVQTTTIVMVMVVVTGFFLWAADIGMMWIIGKITHLG